MPKRRGKEEYRGLLNKSKKKIDAFYLGVEIHYSRNCTTNVETGHNISNSAEKWQPGGPSKIKAEMFD